jgi:hypothetical protein
MAQGVSDWLDRWLDEPSGDGGNETSEELTAPGEPELTFLMVEEIRFQRQERRDSSWSPSSEARLEVLALERWRRGRRAANGREGLAGS